MDNKKKAAQDKEKSKQPASKNPPATKKTPQDEENERLKKAYLDLGPSLAHTEEGIG